MTQPKGELVPTIYLKPADLHVSEEPSRVVTVLGSCVSVTLYNRRLRVGAVCHGALARCRLHQDCSPKCKHRFRFMDCAIGYMIRRFHRLGIANSEIEVKLFGGADTFGSNRDNAVGAMNIKVSLEILEREKLKIVAADVGDSFGRKLIFFTHTGIAYVKRLKKPEEILSLQCVPGKR